MERLNGRYFTVDEPTKYGINYTIRFKSDKPLDSMLPDNNNNSFAGFAIQAERDKYFIEFTDDELSQLYNLVVQMWSLPYGMRRKPISDQIEKIKNKVQRRAGIKNS